MFDIHTHAFHPRLAPKIVQMLNAGYGVQCEGDGTAESLLQAEHAAHVEKAVVLCAAASPSLVVPANNHALAVQREHACLYAFGSLHPLLPTWERELQRLAEQGICGLKLHPDYQGFSLDDSRLFPLLEACAERLCVLVHVGSFPSAGQPLSTPAMMDRLCSLFPKVTFIAAHFGGYGMWEQVLQNLQPHENLWVDTSSTSPWVNSSLLRQLIQHVGEERMCFGSDWPLFDPKEELRRFQRKSGFTDRQMEKLLSRAESLIAKFAPRHEA